MKIPIIRIKNNNTSKEHIVGTKSGDRLVIDNNAITYINAEDELDSIGGDYLFTSKDNIIVEMITLDELIEMAIANTEFSKDKIKELNNQKIDYLRREQEERKEIENAIFYANFKAI